MLTHGCSKNDSEAMAALHALCFGPESWDAGQIEGSLALPTTQGRAVWQAEKLVAFILIQCVGPETEILTLCVAPTCRRQGLACGLLHETMAQTQTEIVFLDVAEDNGPARCLYEACGFTLFGRRPAYYERGSTKVDALNYRYLAAK